MYQALLEVLHVSGHSREQDGDVSVILRITDKVTEARKCQESPRGCSACRAGWLGEQGIGQLGVDGREVQVR